MALSTWIVMTGLLYRMCSGQDFNPNVWTVDTEPNKNITGIMFFQGKESTNKALWDLGSEKEGKQEIKTFSHYMPNQLTNTIKLTHLERSRQIDPTPTETFGDAIRAPFPTTVATIIFGPQNTPKKQQQLESYLSTSETNIPISLKTLPSDNINSMQNAFGNSEGISVQQSNDMNTFSPLVSSSLVAGNSQTANTQQSAWPWSSPEAGSNPITPNLVQQPNLSSIQMLPDLSSQASDNTNPMFDFSQLGIRKENVPNTVGSDFGVVVGRPLTTGQPDTNFNALAEINIHENPAGDNFGIFRNQEMNSGINDFSTTNQDTPVKPFPFSQLEGRKSETNKPTMSVSEQFVDLSKKPMFRAKSKFVDMSGRTEPDMKMTGSFIDTSNKQTATKTDIPAIPVLQGIALPGVLSDVTFSNTNAISTKTDILANSDLKGIAIPGVLSSKTNAISNSNPGQTLGTNNNNFEAFNGNSKEHKNNLNFSNLVNNTPRNVGQYTTTTVPETTSVYKAENLQETATTNSNRLNNIDPTTSGEKLFIDNIYPQSPFPIGNQIRSSIQDVQDSNDKSKGDTGQKADGDSLPTVTGGNDVSDNSMSSKDDTGLSNTANNGGAGHIKATIPNGASVGAVNNGNGIVNRNDLNIAKSAVSNANSNTIVTQVTNTDWNTNEKEIMNVNPMSTNGQGNTNNGQGTNNNNGPSTANSGNINNGMVPMNSIGTNSNSNKLRTEPNVQIMNPNAQFDHNRRLVALNTQTGLNNNVMNPSMLPKGQNTFGQGLTVNNINQNGFMNNNQNGFRNNNPKETVNNIANGVNSNPNGLMNNNQNGIFSNNGNMITNSNANGFIDNNPNRFGNNGMNGQVLSNQNMNSISGQTPNRQGMRNVQNTFPNNQNGQIPNPTGQMQNPNGQIPITSSQTISSNQIAINGQMSVPNGQMQIPNGHNSITNSQHISSNQIASNGQMSVPNGQMQIPNGHNSITNSQNISSTQITSTGQMPVPNGQKSDQNGQMPVLSGNMAVSNGEIPVLNRQFPIGQMPVQNGLPPVSNGQIPIQNGQMPVKNGQMPVSNGQMTTINGQQMSNGQELLINQQIANGQIRNANGQASFPNGQQPNLQQVSNLQQTSNGQQVFNNQQVFNRQQFVNGQPMTNGPQPQNRQQTLNGQQVQTGQTFLPNGQLQNTNTMINPNLQTANLQNGGFVRIQGPNGPVVVPANQFTGQGSQFMSNIQNNPFNQGLTNAQNRNFNGFNTPNTLQNTFPNGQPNGQNLFQNGLNNFQNGPNNNFQNIPNNFPFNGNRMNNAMLQDPRFMNGFQQPQFPGGFP